MMNATKLSTADNNLIAKLAATYNVVPNDSITVAVNPLSGARVQTTALVAAMIRFVQVAYLSYELAGRMTFRNKPVTIQTFDRVRHLVLKLDNNAYAQILD